MPLIVATTFCLQTQGNIHTPLCPISAYANGGHHSLCLNAFKISLSSLHHGQQKLLVHVFAIPDVSMFPRPKIIDIIFLRGYFKGGRGGEISVWNLKIRLFIFPLPFFLLLMNCVLDQTRQILLYYLHHIIRCVECEFQIDYM